MPYYSSSYSTARLLDPYCSGGSRISSLGDTLVDTKKDNYSYSSSTYTNSYGGYGASSYSSDYPTRGRPSAYDRYVTYLDELSSIPRSRTSYSTTSSSIEDDSKLPPLISQNYSRRYGTDHSSNYRSSSVLPSSTLSSSIRPLITSVPAYDKYGKELSNYERWKLQQGESVYTSSESRPLRTRAQAADEGQSILSNSSRIEREATVSTIREIPIVKESSPSYTSRFTGSGLKSSSNSGSGSNYSRNTSHRSHSSFPASVRSKLAGYDVQDVRGDGGCYYRCLSLYFTGSEDNYNKYRKEVVNFIRENLDTYSSMIKSEVGYASTNDYFSRKMRTDHQEFAETTEIIATCCVYDINVHVLAVVPGRHTWEWLHFDPSIGSGKPSFTTRNIYLYNQGSVHFMLCTPK